MTNIDELTSFEKTANKMFSDLEEVKSKLAAELRAWEQLKYNIAVTQRYVTEIQTKFNSLPQKISQLATKVDELPLWVDAKLDEMRLSVTNMDRQGQMQLEADMQDQLEAWKLEFEKAIDNVHLLAERKLAVLGVNVGAYAFPTQRVI